MRLGIERDFRGLPLPAAQHASLRLRREGAALCVEVDAPYFGDPPPAAPVGSTDRLWEYEVCELFIADASEHYLEIELSPHGHHLVLELQGVRRAVRAGLPIDYAVSVERAAAPDAGVLGRYRGIARVPWEYLPARASRLNAYAIHGTGRARCYHAHAPVPAAQPDFHRLECFVAFALDAL
jgi:hypothetical protein